MTGQQGSKLDEDMNCSGWPLPAVVKANSPAARANVLKIMVLRGDSNIKAALDENLRNQSCCSEMAAYIFSDERASQRSVPLSIIESRLFSLVSWTCMTGMFPIRRSAF